MPVLKEISLNVAGGFNASTSTQPADFPPIMYAEAEFSLGAGFSGFRELHVTLIAYGGVGGVWAGEVRVDTAGSNPISTNNENNFTYSNEVGTFQKRALTFPLIVRLELDFTLPTAKARSIINGVPLGSFDFVPHGGTLIGYPANISISASNSTGSDTMILNRLTIGTPGATAPILFWTNKVLCSEQ